MVIRCKYCGAEYNSREGNCPDCGAAPAGDEIEKQKELDEQALKDFRKIAAAEFDRTHPYRERLSPRNRNVVKAMIILVAFVMTITMILMFILIRSMMMNG